MINTHVAKEIRSTPIFLAASSSGDKPDDDVYASGHHRTDLDNTWNGSPLETFGYNVGCLAAHDAVTFKERAAADFYSEHLVSTPTN